MSYSLNVFIFLINTFSKVSHSYLHISILIRCHCIDSTMLGNIRIVTEQSLFLPMIHIMP